MLCFCYELPVVLRLVLLRFGCLCFVYLLLGVCDLDYVCYLDCCV